MSIRSRLLIGCVLPGLMLLSVLHFQCSSPVAAQTEIEPSPTQDRRGLMNQLAQADSFLVIYDESSSARYKDLLQDIELVVGRGRKLRVGLRRSNELQMAELSRFPSLLIGTWSSHALIQQVQQYLPFSFQQQGLALGDQQFKGAEMLFKLFPFPHPANKKMPLFLLTGNTDKAIIDHVQKYKADNWRGMLWQSWGYELYNGGKTQMLGYLSDSSWQVDKRIHFEFNENKDTLAQSPHFTFVNQKASLATSKLQQLQTACEKQYDRILTFLEAKDPQLQLTYYLYPSTEMIGLQTKNTREAQIKLEEQEVHVVESPWFSGSSQHIESYFLLREILGQPAWSPLEKGLVTYLNDQWFDQGYVYWASKIYQAGYLPTLSQMHTEQWWEESSDLFRALAASALVDFLIEKWGKKQFLSQYPTLKLTDELVADLASSWTAFTAARFSQQAPSTTPAALPFCKGFNFAHEGYRIYNGYGSALALQSLQRLHQLNTNAIALVPYSFMRDPNTPSPIPVVDGPGMENDESTVASHYHAKELGMATLLKPQIWLGRSWPGDISFDTEADWEAFFDTYGRWMMHYALLAEIHQMDMLCIGVEFVKATLAKPDQWRALIRSIRKVYSGPLTYAANWGEEFEQLSFWEELDYMGLNCYYPLSKKEKVSKKELQKAFKNVIKKAEGISQSVKRPLLLTEIGFRSIEGPWVNPHAEADGREVNEEHQEWCYETVFKTIQDKDWIHGIFWWKWPSYLGYRGRDNTSFTPNRKKAEAIVQHYFEQL